MRLVRALRRDLPREVHHRGRRDVRDRRRSLHGLRRLRARLSRRLHPRRQGVGGRGYNRSVPRTGWQHAREPGSSADGQPLSVTELNGRAREILELELSEVWVEGALSKINRAVSGHLYFALQDTTSRI